jgi:hypothetical protein
MQPTKYKRITNNECEEISRSLAFRKSTAENSKDLADTGLAFSARSIGTVEKVDIVLFLLADERRIQPDHGAEEKPDQAKTNICALRFFKD